MRTGDVAIRLASVVGVAWSALSHSVHSSAFQTPNTGNGWRYLADVAERRAADSRRRVIGLPPSAGLPRVEAWFSLPRTLEYVEKIGIVACAPGIARSLLGPIQQERDALYSFDDLAQRLPPHRLQGGCFAGPDSMVMAHPWFRRSMHPTNHWAPRFVELSWPLELSGVKKYIAIDEDRVRIDIEGSACFEADTWFGAPFNEDVRQIEAGTVKLRPPLDIKPHHVNFFAQAHCLDIKWTDTQGVKTFQALELKAEEVQLEIEGMTYRPARYLHAEFDVAANCFRHFDGAIQLFLPDEYVRRRDSDFNMTTKSAEHIKARSKKLFKLHGPVDTATGRPLLSLLCWKPAGV